MTDHPFNNPRGGGCVDGQAAHTPPIFPYLLKRYVGRSCEECRTQRIRRASAERQNRGCPATDCGPPGAIFTLTKKDSDMCETDDVESVYLSFDVQDERYAVNSARVTEVVELQKISRVLDVPEFVEGVIALRERVIPVVDGRMYLGLPQREQGAWPTIIVLEADGVPAGLMVDRIAGAVSAPLRRQETLWRDKDERLGTVKVSVIKEVGDHAENVGIVLDVPRLLHTPGVRLDISQQVLMATEATAAGGEKSKHNSCEDIKNFRYDLDTILTPL
jgi:purine-binding chemotaxis protein CheW